jgi:CHASE2 domain-containing sensor protein
VIYGIGQSVSGAAPDEVASALHHDSPWSPMSMAGSLLGGVMSIIGGFVCTRRAQRSDYRLGLVMASLSTLFGLLMSLGQYSPLITALLAAATFGCVILGTRLGLVRR